MSRDDAYLLDLLLQRKQTLRSVIFAEGQEPGNGFGSLLFLNEC